MTDAPLEYNPPHPSAAVILLHGLGASGGDLYPLAGALAGGNMRAVCPHAPARAVTINGGWKMPAWYDIAGADLADRQDAKGVRQSAEIIESLLAAETARRPSREIFLGGFSQGAALALYAGLRYKKRLAGIIALSGYMLLGETLKAEASAANRETPVFQAHGVFDPVVLPAWARQCRDELQNGGWRAEYHEYPCAHDIPPQAVADLNLWLKSIIPPQKES
ncbi:MAG: alpha/beta hydrolase [Gammaproteobacteria bacterium]